MSIWERIRSRTLAEAEAVGFLRKHKRKLIILAIALLLLAPAYAAYVAISNVLTVGPITVGQVQPMTLSWNPALGASAIQYQNNSFGVNVYNPNSLQLPGKWVVEVEKTGVTVGEVDLYIKGPTDPDFVLVTNKIAGTDRIFIESPTKIFPPQTTQTWSFKIKFNNSGQYNAVKVYIVEPASSP